ncbi:MAG: BON domain-containing protein [Betaproteobacteria bacterium]|nr:BON domain-containing protein [Betaproteobacteria bacterium]
MNALRGIATILLPFAAFFAPPALAAIDPLTSLVSKAVSTTLDMRTKAEVATDAEIAAGASKALLDDKKAEWEGVSLLVFAQHAVIAGFVKDEATKKRVQEVVVRDKRIHSLKNELRVAADTSFVGATVVEEKINATLTVTKGISSVNMRWKSVAGHVVLMGVAQSAAESALAQSKIRALDGVKSLKSHLRIVAKK